MTPRTLMAPRLGPGWLLTLALAGLACAPARKGPEDESRLSRATNPEQSEPRLVRVVGDLSFDHAAGALRADLTYSLVPGEAELGFLLNGGLTYDVSGATVTGSEHSVSDFNADWNRVVVRFDPASTGSTTAVRFRIEGIPRMPSSQINQIGVDWVELGLDAMWHPIVDTIDRHYVAELTLRLPRDWQVVSSGQAHNDGDAVVLRNDIPQVDIAFSAAPGLERIEQGHYALFHRGADEQTTTRLLRRANDCRTALDLRFGAEDPLPRGRFVLAARSESGYARKNYVVLTDITAQPDAALTEFLCHELAHYWSSRGAAFTVDNWLNEGFATLIGVQAVRELIGEDAYQRAIDELQARARGLGSIWTPDDLTRRSYAVQYKKAPIALLRLEERVGAEVFERLVRRTMAEVASTPELLDSLEQLTDEETRRWFSRVLSEDDRATR